MHILLVRALLRRSVGAIHPPPSCMHVSEECKHVRPLINYKEAIHGPACTRKCVSFPGLMAALSSKMLGIAHAAGCAGAGPNDSHAGLAPRPRSISPILESVILPGSLLSPY